MPQTSLPRQFLQSQIAHFNSSTSKGSSFEHIPPLYDFTERPEPPKETPDDLWLYNHQQFLNAQGNKRVTPTAYSSRSINVIEGDTASSAKILDRILMLNSVSRDWFTNKRHKPKGEERRRLESLRWRRRFKSEVGKKVALVQQIRKRGA